MGSYLFKWDQPASEVIVTGTFDNWAKSISLQKENGVFTKQVHFPSTDQKIQYKYVVDGKWATDSSVATEPDKSGNINNVLDPADIQTVSVSPLPATSGIGNPIKLAPGEPVPDPSTFTSNTVQSTVGSMSDGGIVIEGGGPFSKSYKGADAPAPAVSEPAKAAADAGPVNVAGGGPYSNKPFANFRGQPNAPKQPPPPATGLNTDPNKPFSKDAPASPSSASDPNKPFAGFKGQTGSPPASPPPPAAPEAPASPPKDVNKPFAGFKGQEAIRTSGPTSPTTANLAGKVPLEPSSRSAGATSSSGLGTTAAVAAGGAVVAGGAAAAVGATMMSSSNDTPSSRIDDPTSIPAQDPNIADEDTMPAIAVANNQVSPPNDPSGPPPPSGPIEAFSTDPVGAPGQAPSSVIAQSDPRTVASAFTTDPIDSSSTPAAVHTPAVAPSAVPKSAPAAAPAAAPAPARAAQTNGPPPGASASAAAQAAAVDNKPFRGRQAAQAVQDKVGTNDSAASVTDSSSVTKRSKRASFMGKVKDAFIPKPAAA